MVKIKIYTTPNCKYCGIAKEYFKSKNMDYEEINLVGNPQAQQEMIAKTGTMSVPAIEVNGNLVVGFDKTKIDEYLK